MQVFAGIAGNKAPVMLWAHECGSDHVEDGGLALGSSLSCPLNDGICKGRDIFGSDDDEVGHGRSFSSGMKCSEWWPSTQRHT